MYYTVQLFHTADLTLAYAPLAIVTSAEFASLILVACLPVMPRLYRHVFQTFSSEKGTSLSEYKLRSATLPSNAQRHTAHRSNVDEKELPARPAEAWIKLDDSSEEIRPIHHGNFPANGLEFNRF